VQKILMVARVAQSGGFKPDSGVLLRPEIPLVIEPFFPDATLVMVTVRRYARGRAVLRGRVMRRMQVAGTHRIGRDSSGLGWRHFGWIGPRLTLR
jgi:hypothetical protein